MNISDNEISRVTQKLLQHKNFLNNEDTAVVFYNLKFVKNRIQELINIFPKNSFHAIAIKANPLAANLKFIKEFGVGVEAASLSEIHLALKSGFSAEKIIFDSPAKTKEEIFYALRKGINVNADSFEELERIKKYLKTRRTKSRIGVRINPQVGTGKILETSVAGEYSKFGIPINEFRIELQKFFIENEWLRGVHLHIGSQGISLKMLLKGAKTIYDFTIETNTLLRKKNLKPIEYFDIGGGLPIAYCSNKKTFTLKDYYLGLKKYCPDIFNSNFKIITEFGRYVYGNSGWALSRVEYVKKSKGISTAIIHLGADMFLRKAYMPDKWYHKILVLNEKGQIKKGRKYKYVIAGPLCFAGDLIAKDVILPKIKYEDFIIIKDAGAYTLSMWSHYNSRQMPKVIGYLKNGNYFVTLKSREPIKNVVNFWR